MLSDVDFSDIDQATKWFVGQSPEVRCAVTSRAALRVFANVAQDGPEVFKAIILWQLRSVLTTACRALASDEYKSKLDGAMDAAFRSGHNFHDTVEPDVGRKKHPFHEVATRNTPELPSFAAFRAALRSNAAANSVSRCGEVVHIAAEAAAYANPDDSPGPDAARPIAFEATCFDSKNSPRKVMLCAAWHDLPVPSVIERNHREFLRVLRSETDWSFWHNWYLGMWEGTFTDWELAKDVALIPDDVWKAGPTAVAAEIDARRLRRALGAELDGFLFAKKPALKIKD